MFEYFKLEEHSTNVKTEVIAGITTFLTMAYILAVNSFILGSINPKILSPSAVFFATAISAAVATAFMGLYANAPIALAPGMGLNAFFTYTVCLTLHYTPSEGLAMVFLSGVIFLIISLLGLRKRIVDAIPVSLKQAIGAGIGFFIAFIGLKEMGVIVANSGTYVGIGNLNNPTIILGIIGLFITLVLVAMDVKAGIFLGIVFTVIIGLILNKAGISHMPEFPDKIINSSFDTSAVGLFAKGLKSIFYKPETIVIVFTMLFVDFFDTAGTLIAVTNKIESSIAQKIHGKKVNMDEIERRYNMDKMFYSDAIGTIVGSLLGTSNVTSYIESSAGVTAGGRTGLTSIVVSILFLISTLFSPLLKVISAIKVGNLFIDPVVSPVLVVVGILMATQLSGVYWHDFVSGAAGFITIIFMLLTFSIATGLAAGFIVYVVLKIFRKEAKEISIPLWILFIIFILYFAIH